MQLALDTVYARLKIKWAQTPRKDWISIVANQQNASPANCFFVCPIHLPIHLEPAHRIRPGLFFAIALPRLLKILAVWFFKEGHWINGKKKNMEPTSFGTQWQKGRPKPSEVCRGSSRFQCGCQFFWPGLRECQTQCLCLDRSQNLETDRVQKDNCQEKTHKEMVASTNPKPAMNKSRK